VDVFLEALGRAGAVDVLVIDNGCSAGRPRLHRAAPSDVTGLRVAWSGAFEEATGYDASRLPVQRTEMFLRSFEN
jgi:hypothetical protein